MHQNSVFPLEKLHETVYWWSVGKDEKRNICYRKGLKKGRLNQWETFEIIVVEIEAERIQSKLGVTITSIWSRQKETFDRPNYK